MPRTARSLLVCLLTLSAASASGADERRALDAHVHGEGTLDIAIDGGTVTLILAAPGADIVGFEHRAATAEDRAAIEAAIADLARPLDLFVLPDAAGCTVTMAEVSLQGGDEADDGHGHGNDHGHDHGDEHGDDHGAGDHTEFHADYTLTCAAPEALDRIDFRYFDRFAGAQRLAVQIVGAGPAQAVTVGRDAPEIDLGALF
ncbi:DUF2796 domain-containing protein [Palleronia sp. KMU-117]|uniref:DUF2796 domain-containing protein n=1 Tax=Palleronia sp. KMU-117 TaxID=3434108 RepID=UPI003D7140CF